MSAPDTLDDVAAALGTNHRGALPAAVLWDMDGTLIDTEPLWMAAEIELVAAHGGVWTSEQAVSLIGSPMSVATRVLADAGVPLPPAEIVAYLNGRVRDGVAADTPWRAGAREALELLVGAGVPLALVTSSHRELAEPFARIAGVFDLVVAGDEVTSNKPDPEPYTLAAARLGVDPRLCVAVEDSRAGVASALASGARTIAVDGHQTLEDRRGLSRVPALDVLTLDVLARISAGETLDLRP